MYLNHQVDLLAVYDADENGAVGAREIRVYYFTCDVRLRGYLYADNADNGIMGLGR